ncbi:type IX secretion system sortase PorU [Lutibacter sp. A80]|uniref:type IX secretion system sortase PorU n=1 Tax=Lutibacter sp. A80 TaxID=2918453 RepID=UPI001F06B6F2|nr:type IX secretion system sortase PorU [Lutibacter sp. A80]UMB61813.1 type IX secretion system sortase PorU [Lutibacter sp. A80]
MKYSINSLIFLFLLVGNFVFAQQDKTKVYKLKWIDNVDFEINKNSTIKTSLIENNFLDAHLNPTFMDSWSVNTNSVISDFSIKNVVYETVAKNNSYTAKYVGNEVFIDLNVVNANNTTLAVLNLMPLVKIDNQIKRIVSFELEYTLAAAKQNSQKISTIKNSVLSEGNWFKFAINKTGVYKIDKDFLERLGVDVNSINPKNISVFGNGGAMLPLKNSDFRYNGLQENAIYVNGQDDASFDDNDYILFYATGPHSWDYGLIPSLNTTKHNFNIYSDKAYYFLKIGTSEGKRITTQIPITNSSTRTITNFDDFTFYEKDEVNLLAVGQQWFGDAYNIENTRTYSLPFEEIDSAEPIRVRVRGVTASSTASTMSVKVNSQDVFEVNYEALSGSDSAVANEDEGTITTSGDLVDVTISYNNNGNPSADAYLDYIEVLGKRKLIAKDHQYVFRNFDILNNSGVQEISIENADKIKWIWDVSNPIIPEFVENQSLATNYTYKVNGGQLLEYVLIPENDFYEPELLEVSRVENQNLHSLKDIDYLIITQDYLVDQAQRLADYHANNSGLITKVVRLDQLYNEFSSGSPDVAAIRDFVKHFYDNATTNQIKYICLFGDASYDYKDRIEGNNNIVPAFESYSSFSLVSSYVTDDFYGMMDANEGLMSSFERQDIATGRIPVTDVLQAKQLVDKLLDYYSVESFGDWRTNITLIADDIDSSGEEVLQSNMDEIARSIASEKPIFNLKKIYLDAYFQETGSSGETYPTVNLDIVNQVDNGTLLVDYFGHGGEDGWASEGIFRLPEIQSLKNKNKLPLFITATCDFSRFDNPLRKTAGEYLFWAENYGASALISTTREIYISVGQAFNERLIEPLLKFNDENLSIAETLMTIKNQFSTTQRFFIYSFGDPAMHLSIPEPSIKLSKMNDKDIEESLDTIKALSYIQFEGNVVDVNDNLLNDFNGEIDVTVFDKVINKKTLDNDGYNIVMEFDSRESKIFRGSSKVENGKFTFDFVAPKDLKVAYGKGKLSFYALNNIIDKSGYNIDVTVGGINENAPADNTGPTVQLYMNDLSFVDGGTTDSDPVFIAVLEDENGINTSVTAVDHDIIAILDNDQANPIILNDYYQTDLDTYKKGKVTYSFRDLSAGLHTITLKVWDTYNNLSESTFNFTVVDNSDLVLSNVLNYPNPFVNYTEFWFNHNKPNEQLEVHIQIFTVSGKLVKTISETVQTEGNLSRTLVWNGLDDFGAKIGKGVYVYKLKVKSINSNTSAQKIEKLVILQ